ncbi:unnamed protein product [Paramecium sonneborni]|uniref:H-type lectin domain-containing protein n=1 Tax=Paramecium sonneborni TaxID=65129 RepID=A0A8S1PGW2_9CILI|nr:unnamed protein product [Paramecium sonneborni]
MVKCSFFLMGILMIPSNCLTTFLTGFVSTFYVWGSGNILYSSSTPNRSFSSTINFSSSFTNIPEVFIINQVYDLNTGSEQGFQFYIDSITRSSFTVRIQLPYTTTYNGIEFRYYAIDDKRRQVISMFNQFNPTQGTLKFQHNNPNFVVGIASVISLQYLGSFSYHLYVSEVTKTDCSITMSFSNTIQQLGYQILLGTKDAFYIKGTIYATSIPSYVAAFSFESGWQDSQLLSVIQGISYSEGTTFRIRLNRNNVVMTQTNYDIELWAGSVLQNVYHQYGAIRPQWNEGFYQSFQLLKFFVFKNYDNNIATILNSFELSIPEFNFQSSISGVFNLDVDNSITDFTLNFIRKCEQGKKLTMQLIQANGCASTYYQYEIICTSRINICKQKFYFQTATPMISKLKITISSDTTFIIEHNYIDQVVKYVNIASIGYV